jgi:hypothetical protein
VHSAKSPEIPLSQWEIDRANRYRAILDTLIEESNETALLLQRQMREQAEAQAEATPPNPKPKPNPLNQDPPSSPRPPSHPPFRPDRLFKTLVQTIESCIRLDAWLADRLARARTLAERAVQAHPNLPAIHDYIHNAARNGCPTEDVWVHKSLDAFINQMLELFPDRNPGDIIAEICHLHRVPYDEAHFPNDWRVENFIPPERGPWDPEEDTQPQTENPYHQRE